MSDTEPNQLQYVNLAADIVSAYVSRNVLPADALPALIQAVHRAIAEIAAAPQAGAAEPAAPTPAISTRKSITPDYLICLEDGRRFKSLKRHLKGLGITPEQYRAKWGLPKDYPMVAPNYAAKRSDLARKLGLGQKRPGAVSAADKQQSAVETREG
jgi:predicted transcriptional regulator